MEEKYPKSLKMLIQHLKKLPGVGSKTAERFAFQMISWPEKELSALAQILQNLPSQIQKCPECKCLMQEGKCAFCTSTFRDSHALCIVSNAKDVYAIDKTQSYNGQFHVLENLLRPLHGETLSRETLEHLKKRIVSQSVKEVIIALDSTLEGDATSLYLKAELESLPVRVTRLAFGLPVGSSLEYIDSGTLIRALSGRQKI